MNEGVLLRIGPNQGFHSRSTAHIWELDGMVHAFKFDANKNSVSMSCSFMETPKLQMERKWKQGIYEIGTEEIFEVLTKDKNIADLSRIEKIVKMGKFFLGRFIDRNALSPFDREKVAKKRHFHCANTDTLQWANKLYALCEGSVFFEFSLDKITMQMESVGFSSINSSWDKYPFIAHPVIDQFNNNNLLVIGHDTEMGNNLGLGVFDTNHNLLKHTQEVHDMSSTEHYILVFDFNIHFGVDLFEKYGTMFLFESNVSSRIGLINKADFVSGDERVRWFEISPAMAFHIGNAWEEENGDVIRIITGRQSTFDFDGILHFDEVNRAGRYDIPKVYEWKLNLKTGVVEERMSKVKVAGVEMPVIHPLFEGQKTKYIWFNLIDYTSDGYSASSYGIVKYDVDKDEIVGRIDYDDKNGGKYGSYQAVFVPKERKDRSKVKSEDDGYLVNIIWDKASKKSNIQIFDAKTMDPKPISFIELPRRVPGGFHSRFIY